MLPRSGTRAAVWQANLSLAAKFRGPLLSGPLGSPCFRARYRDGENKECRPAARHRRPYFANNFCDRVLPLPLPSQRRDFVFWKEWSCWSELLTIFGGQRSFLLVFSRGNVPQRLLLRVWAKYIATRDSVCHCAILNFSPRGFVDSFEVNEKESIILKLLIYVDIFLDCNRNCTVWCFLLKLVRRFKI